MKQIAKALFSLLPMSCQQDVLSDSTLTNREGILRIVVCSRGCYQYVLSTPELSGILQDDSTVISVPAPNDAPVPRFKARNIE